MLTPRSQCEIIVAHWISLYRSLSRLLSRALFLAHCLSRTVSPFFSPLLSLSSSVLPSLPYSPSHTLSLSPFSPLSPSIFDVSTNPLSRFLSLWKTQSLLFILLCFILICGLFKKTLQPSSQNNLHCCNLCFPNRTVDRNPTGRSELYNPNK